MRLITVVFQGESIAINADRILALRKSGTQTIIVLAHDMQWTVDMSFESLVTLMENL